jgi:HSP20 family molecular chaperone IbpA
MDRIFSFALGLGLILGVFGNTASAQEAAKTTDLSTSKAVATTVANPNFLVVTGTVYNAKTKLPITDTRINLDKFGEELEQASMDNTGNYLMSLKKDELGEPTRIIFKVPGFKKFIAKNIDMTANAVNIDIYLEPEDEAGKSTSKVTYSYELNSDAFNTVIVEF